MRSKRNSYSGHHRVEPEATINRRRERATQRAKQKDEIVETPHESVNDKSQISIRETEERGCFWMLSRFCVMTLFTAMIAFAVYECLTTDVDHQSNQIWRDWRFIVPFLVFSFLIFLGLRDSQLRFLLVFPFTVLAALFVHMIWISVTDILNANPSAFWRDWRFIIPLVLFNSQAFLGLKEGWDSCLWNLFRFCFAFPIMVLPAFIAYSFFLFIIQGDSFEFRWDHFTIFLVCVYYLTFLGIFGFIEKWITHLDRKIKRTIRKGTNK